MLDHIAAVDRILSAEQHRLISTPYEQTGNLSVFRCTCGEEFIPNGRNEPWEWPSLAAVHRAIATVSTVVDRELELPSMASLTQMVRGSTFFGSDGALYRVVDQDTWVSQDGRTRDYASLGPITLTLVWAPRA